MKGAQTMTTVQLAQAEARARGLIGGIERRALAGAGRVRAERQGGGAVRLVGHAAVFDSPADLGAFIEIVRPGAFADSLRTYGVAGLVNHNLDLLLGHTRSGTLRLREDSVGLRMELEPPPSALARHWILAIERGDVRGASFSFEVERDQDERWTLGPNGVPVRELLRVRLFDVGPVVEPAYPTTSVAVVAGGADRGATWRAEAAARARALQLAEAEDDVNPAAPWAIAAAGRARQLQLAAR